MTDETEFDPLKIALDHSSNLVAMDILLRALICSHPKPGDLKLALEMLSEGFHDQARDYGFDTSRETKTVQGATSDVQKHINRWLELLKDVPASKPGSAD